MTKKDWLYVVITLLVVLAITAFVLSHWRGILFGIIALVSVSAVVGVRKLCKKFKKEEE